MLGRNRILTIDMPLNQFYTSIRAGREVKWSEFRSLKETGSSPEMVIFPVRSELKGVPQSTGGSRFNHA
jgi:hypothetical protein